ncbi:unnamed protein product [Rotaria socialis]|uniref:F-box domain-containing protein n=1 Tax=Rotaria socialis TaxID=392032 RepID=A0A818IYR5_9BILA|nr:unnamed protein product [Rotaria socialis]CAF3715532.1 unnamed protein product [Rotaria socialis]
MDISNVSILDLPDEILLTIFKKLNNIDLLYSLMGISQKLDRFACDFYFTKDVDLTTVSSNDTSNSRLNVMVDRFCTYILPRIHNNVACLSVQASLFQRILHSSNYPNLRKLTLINLDIDTASHMFNSTFVNFFDRQVVVEQLFSFVYFLEKSLFIRSYKHQISHLVVKICDGFRCRPIEIIIAQTYVAIFTWLSNIQYLNLDGIDGNRYSRRLLRGLSSMRCYSSSVAHLRIRIHNFDDCLCLLDGRLSRLHTLIVKLDFVRHSRIIINNESTLRKLKCFSPYVNRPTVSFDNALVPVLCRMLNMEKLTLSFRVRRRNSFIDGIYLTDQAINYMSHLHTFIFDIANDNTIINAHSKPSSDDIRRTFIERGHHVDCYIDYHTDKIGRCHVYSLPFTMERIHYITSRFPSGMFMNVRVLRVCDIDRSFENTFFAKISCSFPLLSELTVSNTTERLEKPSHQWGKSKEASSIIEYSCLVKLIVLDVHIDYVEQFLSSLNTRLPCLNKLHIRYEHLATVTENFTRDATRINCEKLKCIIFEYDLHLVQSRDFYLYFPFL